MILASKEFDLNNHTYIMGILNVTPDSFSDGGKWNTDDAARRRIEQMIVEGVDIIDVGGESTRPGYTVISDEEEIDRVTPVIEYIRANYNVPISLDTYKWRVAAAGLEAGAHMINDIWGLKHDDRIASVIGDGGAACCIMHNRHNQQYSNFVEDVLHDLRGSLEIADAAGIAAGNIILDPGVGFAKSVEQNLCIMNNMDRIKKLGYPVLLGASRKSCIGKVLDTKIDQRLEGTLATTAVAVMKGCGIVRVHDVKANKRVVMMTEAIING